MEISVNKMKAFGLLVFKYQKDEPWVIYFLPLHIFVIGTCCTCLPVRLPAVGSRINTPWNIQD